MQEENQEQEVRKIRRVKMGGSIGYQQTVQLARKIPKIGFEVGHCYYRPTLKSYYKNVTTPDGTIEPEYYDGLASHYMFQEMFGGVKVLDPLLGNDVGVELPLMYSRQVAAELYTRIKDFDTTAPATAIDLKKAYANYVRYMVNFADSYIPTGQEDRSIPNLAGVVDIEPDEDQKKDPDFDEDAMVIENFKAAARLEKLPGVKDATLIQLMAMTADKAITKWSLKNTDIAMAYTYTCNANFDGAKFWGSIEPEENDGGLQMKQCNILANLARAIAQHNFELSGLHGGASPDSKAYRDAFDDWLGMKDANNRIMSNPNPNGIIFVYSQEAASSGKQLVKPNGASEAPLSKGIMNWSPKKTEKVKAEQNNGLAFADPDVCQVVYKFTTGSTEKDAGRDMSVVAWEGSVEETLPFDKVFAYVQEIAAPTTCDRINNYKPIDMEGLKVAFKKYIKRTDLSWMTAEDRAKHQSAFDLLDTVQTPEDINNAINGAAATTVGGVDMGIGIATIATDDGGASALQSPAPNPTPSPTPTPTPMPTPNPQ